MYKRRKNFRSSLLFCFTVLSLVSIPALTTGQNGDIAIYDPIELTNDGSWGYAGHHAYIANNTLFFTYLDTDGELWVASYDLGSGEISRNNIWNVGADLHAAHPLVIRPDGRIQVFLARSAYHDGRIRWKVSSEPWSVKEFGELQKSSMEADITQGRQFYPMLHKATGEMYMLVNASQDGLRHTVMWRSKDGGDTWARYHTLWALGQSFSGQRSYSRAYLQGDDIHIVTLKAGWGEQLAGQSIGRVEGVYYTKYIIPEQAFFGADGSRSFDLGDVPVYDTHYFDEIWHRQKDGDGTQRALWSDIVADENGHPYVAFVVQDAVERGRSALHDAYRATPDDDGRWNHNRVGTLARGWDNRPERLNYAIALDSDNPQTVFLARSTSQEEDLSQIHRMSTPDGGKSWQVEQVLSEEGRLTTVVVPRILDHSGNTCNVLWLEGIMEGWQHYDTRIMARCPAND